jgi:hypothetical protein
LHGIITNTPHKTVEACAIVENAIGLADEGRQLDLVAVLLRSIWGAEPGRLLYLNRPSFHGDILCCWRPRWIEGSEGSPMHAYTSYIWRKTPRCGPSLKVRIGKAEAKRPIDFASGRGASRRQRGPIQEMLTNSP